MGKLKEKLQKVYDEYTELYSEGGASAVCDHVLKEQRISNPLLM
jgi:hypothetical protein